MTWLRSSAVFTFLVALAACPNPNTYTSARTLRAGDAQVLVAAEGYAMLDPKAEAPDKVQLLPSLPTVGVRYGFADSAEIGLRAVNLMSLATDTKIQLRRGDLDVALNPGVQWHREEGDVESQGMSQPYAIQMFDLQLPLLLGLNVSPRATIVVSPGVMFRTSIYDSVDYNYFGLAGFGFNIRATRRLALQPQVTLAWDVREGGGSVAAGLGLTFGGQPSFNELVQATEPPQVSRR